MREATNNISVAVERVKNLKGIDLKLLINRGRNRFIRVDGVIEDLYPNVFTVKTEDAHTKILTLTYADVMMKKVRFFPRGKNEKESKPKT
jgi:uncharacterized protein Veg